MMGRGSVFKGFMLLLFFLTLFATSASAYTPAQWHALSQSQRNAAIVARANQDLNKLLGQSCKEWVRTVILNVSGGGVTIPPTEVAPYDYLWKVDPYGYAIGMSMPIQNVAPGYIVQMRLRSGWPHTAIVTKNSGSSVTFVESNWDSTPGVNSDAYVRARTVTYAQFTALLQSSGTFSVYYIK